MSDVRLQLESIKGKRPNPDSNLKEKLIAILKEVLQPNASLNPTEAAAVIDDLAPKFREADRYGSRRKLHMEPAIENFMTQLWELLFEAMQLVPPEHLGHTRAISMLHALCKISGDLDVNTKHGPLRWRHLPCLTRYFLEGTWHWTEPFDEREWLNLMSFAARLLGSGLVDAENGVWDLEYVASYQLWHIGGEYGQQYLKGDLKRDLALGEEWITHAGATILQIARRNFYKPNVAHPRFFTRCRNMFNIRNWERWQRRLLEVGAEVDGDLSSRCLMLAHKMKLLERD